MSMYNVAVHVGGMNTQVLKDGWLGFSFAYAVAMICDWFLVSKLAKGFAFRFAFPNKCETNHKNGIKSVEYEIGY